MSEHTPTPSEIRAEYLSTYGGGMVDLRGAEFDRMIAEVERAAAVRALEEAAGRIKAGSDRQRKHTIALMLRARAAEIRERKSS